MGLAENAVISPAAVLNAYAAGAGTASPLAVSGCDLPFVCFVCTDEPALPLCALCSCQFVGTPYFCLEDKPL